MIIEEIEKQIAKYVGTRFAILCNSGRAAIRFSLLAFGISQSDEVIIPDYACQILPHTVMSTGALPVFCDIDPKTITAGLETLKEVISSKTKALIFTHLYGLPVDPSPILELTSKKGIIFIDDAAQSLGAHIGGTQTGTFGDVGILSFNKFLKVPLGGAAVTNNKEIAAKISTIRTRYEKESIIASLAYYIIESLRITSNAIIRKIPSGVRAHANNSLTADIFDYLMSYRGKYWHSRKIRKIESLILWSELRNIEKYLKRRRIIADIYDRYLNYDGYQKIQVPKEAVPSFLRYPIIFSNKESRVKCIENIKRAGYHVSYLYKPLHRTRLFKMISQCYIRDRNVKIQNFFNKSIFISENILPLPIDLKMSNEEINKIIKIVNYTCSSL